MAKVGGQQPRAPSWPWGGPREVRGKLVDRTQLEKKNVRKKGDPKNPALASTALIDFIGPAHSSEELRLPMPPGPAGHDADLESYTDRGPLTSVAERLSEENQESIQRGLATLRAPPDRVERLKSLLTREAQMLALVNGVSTDMAEIERKRREETANEGY
ncbi:MAG: hypothetical protein DI536_26310 [Archangium gephyra]|uniref:Uncharacterized protein n=1 Tax=Archangium gephyra TaxID=48 RepID=A0A2W5UFZ9_9BACT|nr:MAG: hypothetical protein DI536_26310 [Archangium gephyra]